MSACHTQEQEKYRSYMFYVYIFQLFFTFVSYENCLVVKKWENVSNWPKQSKKYVRSDVVTQKIQYKGVLTVYLLILKMFQTDFCCTMNICPNFFATVGSVNNIKVLWPNYLVFSLVKLFFLASPLSFLASLVMLMHLKSESLPWTCTNWRTHYFFSLKQPFGHNKRLQWKNKWTILTLV